MAQSNILTKGMPSATNAEIAASYAKNRASSYTIPHSAHIKHILLTSKDAAERAYAEIMSGQSFDKFYDRSRPPDGFRPPDGDEPRWVDLDQPNDSIVPAGLVQLIRKSRAGEVISPYTDYNGYWIVQVMEIRLKEALPLEKVRDFVRLEVLGDRTDHYAQRLSAYSEKLYAYRRHARVVVLDPKIHGFTVRF